MNKIVVYLAGGFKSGWQDKIIASSNAFEFIDPRSHGLKYNKEYTFWDLQGIDSCDWLFGYMEADNPAGYALAYEMGYAKGVGKKVLLVDEKSYTDSTFDNWFGMCRAGADVTFSSFEHALEFVKKF